MIIKEALKKSIELLEKNNIEESILKAKIILSTLLSKPKEYLLINENQELDNIIILNDEEGNEVKFEFLDLVELDDEEYVVLLPVTEEGEEEEGEVVILKVEDTDEDSDEESYVSIDDEDTLNKVFEIFKEKFKDDFDFVD